MLTAVAPHTSESDVDELKRMLLLLLHDPDVREALSIAIASDLDVTRDKRRLFV
jgi:hypothetical protein